MSPAYGESWRRTPSEQRERDLWKLASRGVILRVFYRLEERGFSMADCAQVWDTPIGVRWFSGLVVKAESERVYALDSLAQFTRAAGLDAPERLALSRFARAGINRLSETVHA